ncbi:MAG TPA: hypothetical protein VGX25_34805 [Actinophytocola sp.]|uniref:hypothetical protein n=1 Tax=Actinophytocola sp. TaxID=1872138 RepID=UPI002DDDB65F|nr:hypothetical protein [Actinophytocola sp.]HEV2784582.1 hypothetical protein [Actinophytocola sp.]
MVLGLVSILTAGCGGEPAVRDQGHSAPDEVAEPKQPFDVILGQQVGLIGYAQLKIRDRCLADAGYRQNLDARVARPEDPYDFLTVSARDFGPTSEDEARRLGFGNHTGGEPARVVSTDANFDKAAERCAERAWTELGPEARRTLMSYTDLVNTLAPYRHDVDAELPDDLPARMLECMAGRGYHVPDRAAFLKTPNHRLFGVTYGRADSGPEESWQPVRKPGTVEVGPAIPPRRYTPTPEESALAVAWFHCGRSTGKIEAQLAAVQRVQARYVEKYGTWIDELNPRIEELARRAAPIASGS